MSDKAGVTVQSLKEWFGKNKITIVNESSDHFQMNCLLCGDTRGRLGVTKVANKKKHVEIGGWNCFNCNSNGKKFSSLEYAILQKQGLKFKTKDVIKKEDPDGDFEKKSTITDDFHKKYIKTMTRKDCGVLGYLTDERKISKEAIEYFQLGARRVFLNKRGEKVNKGDHLVLPYLTGEKCVNIKYRALDPEVDKKFKWLREKGGITALFNDNVIDDFDHDEIIIAESEIDAISIWCMGFKNVIGLTAGAGSFKQAWYERLLRFKKVYLVLDNDEAGQEGAEEIAKRIGLSRCYNIVLPDEYKDPNDFLRVNGKADVFKGYLDKGTQFGVPAVKSLREIMQDTFKKRFRTEAGKERGIRFPYKTLADKTGLLKEGHLVVIAARPKVGKTTFSLDFIRRLALGYQKLSCGFFSCEMSLEALGDKFATQVTPTLDNIDDITEEQYLYAQMVLKKAKIQMCRPEAVEDLEPEKIVEKITSIVQRYGVKIFVFDNLHFACRTEDEYTAIGKLTQALKICAEQLGIVIVAITHPRKVGNKRITNDDLKGSSSIFQDADLVILMNRETVDLEDLTEEEQGMFNGQMSPLTEFDVTSRWSSGGRSFMFFNETRSLFKDSGSDYDKMLEMRKAKKGIKNDE